MRTFFVSYMRWLFIITMIFCWCKNSVANWLTNERIKVIVLSWNARKQKGKHNKKKQKTKENEIYINVKETHSIFPKIIIIIIIIIIIKGITMINKNTNKKLCTWKTCKMITFYAYVHLKYNFIEGFFHWFSIGQTDITTSLFSACIYSIWFSFAIQYISVECWLIKIFHFLLQQKVWFFYFDSINKMFKYIYIFGTDSNVTCYCPLNTCIYFMLFIY